MTLIEIIRIIDLNFLSLVILALILAAVHGNRQERGLVSTRLFILLIVLNMIMTVLDMLGWIWNGLPGEMAWMGNLVGNLLLYCMVPLPAAAWYLYAHYQVFHNHHRLQRPLSAIIPLIAMNILVSCLSVRTGWFFYIDENNIYHRGPWFPAHVATIVILLTASCLLVLRNRRRLEGRYFRAMLLFVVPPVIGATLQVLFYGLSLNWPSMMISVLIVYLQMQDRGLNTDFLTGTYNRRHFEKIISNRIHRQAIGQGFAVIIADLDGFKKINDQFGHDVGDEALLTSVRLIRHCLRRNDLIARFGGDEFYILLDLSDQEALNSAVRRINHEFEQHNQTGSQPYHLSISMGAAIYPNHSRLNAEQFLRSVDKLMYEEKSRRQAALRDSSANP